MDQNELKRVLFSIKEEGYEVPGNIKPFDLALDMLTYIGTTESELRDDLIYVTFYKWIINDEFNKDELRKIVKIALDDEHLFYKLGEVGDSVFTRTFSVLVLALLVYKHREDNYLSKENINRIYNKVIKYIREEKDLRGYTEEKGWAHGMAHGADVLDELAQCDELEKDNLIIILDDIQNKISINYHPYIYEEDERMVTAVMSILNRDLIDEEEILGWIENFSNILEEDEFTDKLIKYFNIKNFLRSLYFRLLKDSSKEALIDKTKKILDVITHF
ncbi:DUF2785 domain-containing protein [Clostridium sp. D2Q-11]|uniref:DUF2785 domain-containing protein n=1 Tax=Anaeromonas frigoriresistens TaxID=2683708 RepID=A0A942Z7S8_9FIRM|nr:DUF2785 domain-containing protein [Anaeromonas frigoriresistens]MBS4537260.1 DUF2785 domain-containing protein [Anaeromonas frigoriresistens]